MFIHIVQLALRRGAIKASRDSQRLHICIPLLEWDSGGLDRKTSKCHLFRCLVSKLEGDWKFGLCVSTTFV